jgi:pimeloyl-ACP methyl ester carboxylesterase
LAPSSGVASVRRAAHGRTAWFCRGSLFRPVWGVFGTSDRCIDPGVHRFSYDRMGATVTEVEGASHVVMISHPKEVAEVVMTAARKVS